MGWAGRDGVKWYRNIRYNVESQRRRRRSKGRIGKGKRKKKMVRERIKSQNHEAKKR